MEIQFTTRNKNSHILYHTYITLDNKNKNNISADYVQMSEQVFENTSLGKMPLYLKEQINQAQQIIKQLIINRFEIALANNADFIAKNSILQQLNLEVELFLRFEKTTITKNWTTNNFVNNFKNSSFLHFSPQKVYLIERNILLFPSIKDNLKHSVFFSSLFQL